MGLVQIAVVQRSKASHSELVTNIATMIYVAVRGRGITILKPTIATHLLHYSTTSHNWAHGGVQPQ